jgi:hypothetical protein
MKKVYIFIFINLILGVLAFPLEGASNSSASSKAVHSTNRETTSDRDEEDEDDDEYDLLDRDEIDNSNTLAIPFDDSELEDEEEIDRDEKTDTFYLPHSR